MKIGVRTVNNALFNAGSSMLPLLLSFVFWPFIVDQLGDASYGIFAVVGTVIGYFALLDLGLGNAVVKYIAEYTGKNDKEGTGKVMGVALSIFVSAGVLGWVIIMVLARPLAVRFLKIPPELTHAAFISFCAAAFGFFFTMMLTLMTSIINGLNRYDISGVSSAVMGAACTLGAVILLRLHFGLIAVVCLNVSITLLTALFYLMVIRRLLPGQPFRMRWHPDTLKRILHFGVYAMLSRITDVIMRQVDLLIIAAILGVASVTYYVIPFTILNRLIGLIGRVGMVLFPAISELQGQNRHDTIRELYIVASRLILSFALAFTIPLLIFGSRFLYLWMTPAFAERGGVVIFILTIGILVDLCSSVPSFVVDGLGHPKISGFTAVATAICFLCMMVPGAIYGGIIGVALAFTVSISLVVPVFVWLVNNRILGLTIRDLFFKTYVRPIIAGLIVAIPLLLVPQQRITNILSLLVVMGCGCAGYMIIALCLGVYEKRERRIFMEYAQRITGRISRKGK